MNLRSTPNTAGHSRTSLEPSSSGLQLSFRYSFYPSTTPCQSPRPGPEPSRTCIHSCLFYHCEDPSQTTADAIYPVLYLQHSTGPLRCSASHPTQYSSTILPMPSVTHTMSYRFPDTATCLISNMSPAKFSKHSEAYFRRCYKHFGSAVSKGSPSRHLAVFTRKPSV